MMSGPVLMQATCTNELEMLKYIPLIRRGCPTVVGPLYLVLDNHAAHHSKKVAAQFRFHHIIPLFMPAYSPEFNSIESLWAIIKSRVKKVLNAERDVKMTQARFSEILQSCLDTVTPDESSTTARGGNR
jgi:hypothetical protein